MKRSRTRSTRALAALAVFAVISPAGRGFGQAAPPSTAPGIDVDSHLAQARAHMQQLEYESAIALLEPVLEATRFHPDRLRDTYVLLIEAHVYRGNLSAAGTKEQKLWHDEAHELIRECLGVRELRHVQPWPPEKYPAKMMQFFDDVRREMFGTFEIGVLDPPEAEVILAGEVLVPDRDGILRQTDVPIGTHLLVIRRPGYREIAEDVEISAATVVTRSYALERKKGLRWYATRVLVPVVAIAGAVAIGVSGGDAGEPDLGGPPPPPTLP